jgi:hypothetical protein
MALTATIRIQQVDFDVAQEIAAPSSAFPASAAALREVSRSRR